MIEEKLNMLKSKYKQLPSAQQKDIESIVAYLIDFTDQSGSARESCLHEINRYLSDKTGRERRNRKPVDIFRLRNIIVHKRRFKSEYDDMLQKLVWNILPDLSYFKNLEKLSNFLGNYLHVDIEDDENIREKIKNRKLKTKHEVVSEYKKIHAGFARSEQKKSLRELARGMFVVAQKDELAKFRELI